MIYRFVFPQSYVILRIILAISCVSLQTHPDYLVISLHSLHFNIILVRLRGNVLLCTSYNIIVDAVSCWYRLL